MNKRYILYIVMIAIGTFLIAAGLRDMLTERREATEAREEYDMLYAIYTGEDSVRIGPTITSVPEGPVDTDIVPEDPPEEPGFPTLDELYEMNNDFIGWFSIAGLIEYPVVQGRDNDKYINTTFMGERNRAGSIFMDYRHAGKWDEPVCILFGHRTYDGAMFAPLGNYLNSTFMYRNNTIEITTRDGETLTYRIFAAIETDAWDPVYEAAIKNPSGASETFPNVPDNATRFLVLSTCTRSADPDERILVFAAME